MLSHDSTTPFAWGSHGRFRTASVQFGGVPKLELIKQMKAVRGVHPYAEGIILHDEFATLEAPETRILADISPVDRGFKKPPTMDELLDVQRLADWSGANLDSCIVEPCPAEAVPPFAIQYKNQPNDEVIWIAMKRILVSGGGMAIFKVRCNEVGKLWLYHEWVYPLDRFRLDSHILYLLSAVSQASAQRVGR